jgi:hypothetical protein
MTANRKAELQRKLALRPVPKPPAGLSERIKHDIPKQLLPNTDDERRRLRRAVAFDMRVAASILLLVSSMFVALHFFSRAKETKPATNVAASAPRSDAPQLQVQPAVVDETKVAATETKPAAPLLIAQSRPAAKPKRAREEAPVANVASGVVGGVVGGLVATLPPPPAPPPPAEPPPVAVADAKANDIPAASEKITVAEAPAAPQFLKVTAAAPNAQPTSLFGVKLDSVVQRFAAPLSRPPHDMRLDTEVVEHPFDKGRAIVRVSLDAPAERNVRLASAAIPGAVSDAELELDLAHPAGSPETTFRKTFERMLPFGSTVTAVYDVPIEDGHFGTVRFSGRSETSGRAESIDRKLDPSDVKTWDHASRRTKLAALAALWQEAKKANAPVDAIRAEAKKLGADDLIAAMER